MEMNPEQSVRYFLPFWSGYHPVWLYPMLARLSYQYLARLRISSRVI